MLLTWPLLAAQTPPGVRLRSIGGDPASGIARAVVVEQGALAHTATMYPEDREAMLLGAGDAYAQAEHVLANIDTALQAAGTTLDNLVRLHVYVAGPTVTSRVEAVLAGRFGGRDRKPAATFVQTETPAGVLVMMDAVAATGAAVEPGRVTRLTAPTLPLRHARAAHVAIQPAGPFVSVSGRAARGEFDAAIRGTMAQLRADLGSVGLGVEHVVQVKGFLDDMRRLPHVEEIVVESFESGTAPPQVFTEWRQDAVPAEIELIALSPAADASRPRVEHFEPILGRYSRIARVNAGHPVFLSGLYGRATDVAAQVDEMFAELQEVLQASGSDMQHLVKATYYVSDAAADARINAVRPTVFDPQRPPAASKLSVRGTARDGKGSTFDMIAVTAAP